MFIIISQTAVASNMKLDLLSLLYSLLSLRFFVLAWAAKHLLQVSIKYDSSMCKIYSFVIECCFLVLRLSFSFVLRIHFFLSSFNKNVYIVYLYILCAYIVYMHYIWYFGSFHIFNAHKTEYMCFNQTGDISTLNGCSLKLVDKFTYPRNRHRHASSKTMDS